MRRNQESLPGNYVSRQDGTVVGYPAPPHSVQIITNCVPLSAVPKKAIKQSLTHSLQ